MSCLFYHANDENVYVLNGSADQIGSIPLTHVLAVTTLGAAAGWVNTVERFGSGKLTMERILRAAIELCEEGFTVSEVSARLGSKCHLTNGKEGFYNGPIVHPIVEAVHERGGLLSVGDLALHVEKGSTTPDPICIRFNDMVDVWEHPPNGQRIVALMALVLLKEIERTNQITCISSLRHISAEYIHALALIKVFRIAFSDA
ncbi:uncharacterized protein BHQ10_002873 [Talaromyces amestolkiae]|uniref:Uncharacterized protein n=1 Tax=Talaromyces amestolkiae TaxID=1196081 RepID=A0A364KTP0_TALAM|nr:uncharacterized protein BHQ10_002873 [Talaromyces amestolkiae]RAO66861.1 hypothetical protein BHQ10_002873 [Talaromyces amestolkiae]